MGNNIGLKLITTEQVLEPTLWQIQQNSGSEFENIKPTPAWLQHSQLHPGLPEHYFTITAADPANIDAFPQLPFHVNREIFHKIVIIPTIQKHQKLPSLSQLGNGSIVISGNSIQKQISNNVEIFLFIQEKLLPCCWAERKEVILKSPSTAKSKVRCYYVFDTEHAKLGIVFNSSEGESIYQCQSYDTKWLHGSTPYDKFLEVLQT